MAGWTALSAHPALAAHVAPLAPPCVQDGTPHALRTLMCSLILAPPGATQRLHVAPKDTHVQLSLVRGQG